MNFQKQIKSLYPVGGADLSLLREAVINKKYKMYIACAVILKGMCMIKLTRLNGTVILVNESFLESAEEAPDTVLTMQNGHRYLVKEKIDEIIALSEKFRKECYPMIHGQE